MNERDILINKLIEEKGGTREQYLDLLNSIAYHESAGTFDPKLHQYGGGPGRGKYQFEVGKNKGAITAARRLKSYYKDNNINIPNWLNKATKDNSLDVTELTPEQQDLLFLGNMRMHPKADLANIFNGNESIPEFWAKYHWAGNKSDRSERLKSFNSSYENYKNSSPEELIANIEQNVAEEIDYREPLPTMVQESTQVREPMNMNSLLSYIKQNNQPQQQPQSQPQQYYDKELNHYNGGGTHQENPLGGIPQGNKSVEANETSFKLPQGKFIFSDRIDTNGQMQPKLDGAKQQVSNSYNNQFAYGGLETNTGCGGKGQPPCPEKETELNAVYLTKDNERAKQWKAYQDSLGLYNKSKNLLDPYAKSLGLTYEELLKQDELDGQMASKDNVDNYMSKEFTKYGHINSPLAREAQRLNIAPISVYDGSRGQYATNYHPVFKKPTPPIFNPKVRPVNSLNQQGPSSYNITANVEDLKAPILDVPYNLSDVRFPNSNIIKKDGKFRRIQSREEYRRNNLRPNGTPYPEALESFAYGGPIQNSYQDGGNMDLINNYLRTKQVKKKKKKK